MLALMHHLTLWQIREDTYKETMMSLLYCCRIAHTHAWLEMHVIKICCTSHDEAFITTALWMCAHVPGCRGKECMAAACAGKWTR